MAANLKEQETTINILRDEEMARIYTSDTTIMTKLDKLAESSSCPDWKLAEEIYDTEGTLVAKIYETKKRLISFRSSVPIREMTEEQREAATERLRKWWEARKQE